MKNRLQTCIVRAFPAILGIFLHSPFSAPVAAQADPSPTPEPAAVAPAAAITDRRFGVIESFEDPSAAGRLGVAWTRARFQWAEMQPDGPDDWQPPLDDETLDDELAAGREVVGLLIGIPQWARDGRGLPRGLDLPADDPENTWASFVAETVNRYEGRIDHWIIWNEPDIDDDDAPGHTWDGTIEEYFQLQRTAYLAAKAANPDAVVHLGAFTYFWDPSYFSRFLDIVAADPDAADNNHYFDIATAHLYFQTNAIYNVLYAFRNVMDGHGLDQPVWLVETNAPPIDDPYWTVDNWTLSVTIYEQAAFVPQALAVAMAAGADRIAFYKLKDTEDDLAANPEPFGLLRWDDSRRPAFDTYRIAIRMLSGVTSAARARWDGVGQVRLEQAETTTTVLFARLPDPQIARVEAVAATAELVDMWGVRETIEARGGYFTVELPGALCTQTIADYCMIGGTTFYLIQQPDEDSAAAVKADSRMPDEEPATGDSLQDSPPVPVQTELPTSTPSPEPSSSITATSVPAEAAAASGILPPPAATEGPPPATPAAALPDEASADPEPEIAGLFVLGLGIALGLGMVGWWILGRK